MLHYYDMPVICETAISNINNQCAELPAKCLNLQRSCVHTLYNLINWQCHLKYDNWTYARLSINIIPHLVIIQIALFDSTLRSTSRHHFDQKCKDCLWSSDKIQSSTQQLMRYTVHTQTNEFLCVITLCVKK